MADSFVANNFASGQAIDHQPSSRYKSEPYRTVRLLGALRMLAKAEEEGTGEWTTRQGEVLDAALALLMEEGDRFTMTSVARRASCSKETLYKWFGDRAGLVTAVVQWQASKVRVDPLGSGTLDLDSLTARLELFAHDWLTVISSPTSIALNRLAVAHSNAHKSDLGAIVLANGRFALARRLKPVLEAARRAGVLKFEDSEEAFRTFFGLVGRDVQIRLLLGDGERPDADEIQRDAERATSQFLALYGSGADSRS